MADKGGFIFLQVPVINIIYYLLLFSINYFIIVLNDHVSLFKKILIGDKFCFQFSSIITFILVTDDLKLTMACSPGVSNCCTTVVGRARIAYTSEICLGLLVTVLFL